MRNLEIIELNGEKKPRCEHLLGQIPKWAKRKLRIWGEAATIKISSDTSAKSDEHGVTVMFVAYCPDRPSDCYEFFNPKTLGKYYTRDVTWLHRMYFGRSS